MALIVIGAVGFLIGGFSGAAWAIVISFGVSVAVAIADS